MANRDIAGLLTGIPSQGIDPMTAMTPAQQRMQMGAQAAGRMSQGIRGMMGVTTPQEAIAQQVGSLDQSNPNDLLKIAKLQQVRGDSTGSAKTLARVKELQEAQQEEVAGSAIETALADLGLHEDLVAFKAGALTQPQANAIIQSTRKANVASKGTTKSQLTFLLGQGIKPDHPLYMEIEGGTVFTDTQLASLVKLSNKRLYNEITVTGLKLTDVIIGVDKTGKPVTERMNVGNYTIDKGDSKQQFYGRVKYIKDEEGNVIDREMQEIDPSTVVTSADKTAQAKKEEAIDVATSDIDRTYIALETAGSEAKGETSLLGIGTDWNEAWKDLSGGAKASMALLVAQETQRYLEYGTPDGTSEVLGASYDGKPMDLFDAQREAIKRLWTNKLKEGFWGALPLVGTESRLETFEEQSDDEAARLKSIMEATY